MQQPCAVVYSPEALSDLGSRIDLMRNQVCAQLEREGIQRAQIETDLYLNLRYEGTDTSIMTLQPAADGKHKG